MPKMSVGSKRLGALPAAEELLLHLVEATEAESRVDKCGPAPWYYKQLAIIFRKQKRFGDEIAILERYDSARRAVGLESNGFEERKRKARAKMEPLKRKGATTH